MSNVSDRILAFIDASPYSQTPEDIRVEFGEYRIKDIDEALDELKKRGLIMYFIGRVHK